MSEEQTKPTALPESPDELRALLAEAQKKLTAAELAAEKDEAMEAIDLPVADIELLVMKGHSVHKPGVTPPEVLILTAQFHKEAGGLPIKDIKLTGKTRKVDPRALVAELCRKYGAAKVKAFFPGAEPRLPMTFRRAIGIGVTSIAKDLSLGEINLTPSAPEPAAE